MKGGVLVDAKDNAYLEYLEAQFEDERHEETEDRASCSGTLPSRHERTIPQMNRRYTKCQAVLDEIGKWLVVGFWVLVALVVVWTGTLWFYGLPILILNCILHPN